MALECGAHFSGLVLFCCLLRTPNLQESWTRLSDSEKQDLHTELPMLASPEVPFNQKSIGVTTLVLIQHKTQKYKNNAGSNKHREQSEKPEHAVDLVKNNSFLGSYKISMGILGKA